MKKILLIRFSSIGDIVLTSPVVRALKTQIGCELHVLTKQKFSFLFVNNPYVDQVHTLKDDIAEVLPALKLENFDFVVDLQKNLRSYRVKKALGKPSASFPKLNKQKWLLVNFKLNNLPDIHIVDRYFKAVASLGVANDLKGLDYFIPESAVVDPSFVHRSLSGRYVAIAIGGQHTTKMMPTEKLVGVIEKIKLPVVLLGDKSDNSRGEEIVQQLNRQDVFNVCGQFSLDQSASLIRQAAAVISHDTGLMHIAAAFKKPVVSIWGNTVPDFGMYPYLPNTPELSVIAEVNDLKCRPCSKLGYKKCPKKHFRCMIDQDETFIAKSVTRLIQKQLK